MKDIVFIISYLPLGRILRRLKTASSAGSVAIIYWNRMLKNKTANKVHETIEQIEISQKATEGNPLGSLLSQLIFFIKALLYLKKLKPKVIHVELLNMLFIAFVYKCLFSRNVSIIYEVSDLHSILIDKQKNIFKRIISKSLFNLEKFLCHCVRLVIVTSEYFIDEYYSFFLPKEKILFIPNSPEEGIFDGFKRKQNGPFTIGFIGYVRYKNQLEMLINVSQHCDINVLIAGVGTDYQYLYEKFKSYENVNFYGPYEYEKDIKHLYEMVDCVYSVYDASLRNVQIALPNKLYESIICGLPILVAKNTKLAELVNEWEVGVEVSCISKDELLKVIQKLKNDKEYYNSIINNCLRIKEKVSCKNINEKYIGFLKNCL